MKKLLKVSLVALASIIVGACSTTTVDNPKANAARQQLAANGIPFSPQALCYFAGEGDTSKVQLFLDGGMDVNATAGNASALTVAVAYQKVDMVRYLIGRGADVNLATYHGTALSVAAWNGNAEITRILLQSGANPNAVILDGHTALTMAAYNNKAEDIKVLVEHGANVNYIHPVTSFSPLVIATYYGKKDAALALINAGANVNYVDANGVSVLDWSQIGSYNEITKALVAKGAKVEMKKNNTVPTVMLAALAHEDIEMIDFLAGKGVSVNGLADGKMPIIIWCAKCNVPKSAMELIKLGANTSVKDLDGYTVLDWAMGNTEIELVKMLDPKVDISKLTIPKDPNVQTQATLIGDLINDQYYQPTVTTVQSLEGALTGVDTQAVKDLRKDKVFKNPAMQGDKAVTHPEWENVNEFQDFDKQIQTDMESIDKALNAPQPGNIETVPVDSDPYNKQLKADISAVHDSLKDQTAAPADQK